MAASFISELGDRLGGAGVANTEGSHVKTISAEYYKRNDDGTVSNARIQDAVDAAATKTELSTGLAGKAASTHSHGNITSDGKVGTTANKPLITTTGGTVTTGSFGTSANTFCQGNDSRLSDARTPTAHASTATTYGVGSSTNYGHVKLYDNVTGSNTDGAPTQKAVKEAIAAVEGSKVKATAKSDNVNYKLLATASASPTSGALTEAVYDTDITLNPSTNTISASIARTFTSSSSTAVSETPIITVSGSTDGFKLTYGSETADTGITKLFTTDDANAKLSFGNMVSSTYKEALAISNGSANLTGTVNGYTIGKSVPSDAVFTDTTYTANNGVSLSGTTFSNSGVRSTTINGDYLRVNTNGTNADLTIPYATNAHRLRAAYAEFNNTTGYRLLAEIHPITGISENTIATFDAFFTSTNNNYSLAHIYVNIRTNHDNTGTDTYVYYWGYIDKNPAYSGTQILAYTKTGSNSLFLFAYVSTASWCGVQLSINQTSDYNGHYRVMDIVDLKHDDTLVASLDSSYTQLNATKSYHNVLAATSQVGSSSVPVYIKSNGTVDTCTVGSSNGLASLDANGKVPTSQLPSNSSSSAGIVASGSGMVSKVWGTDVSGNPAWRNVSTTFGLEVTQNNKYRRVAILQFSSSDFAASGIVGTIFFRFYDSTRTGQVDFALSFRDYDRDYIVGSMYSRNSRGLLPSIRIGAVKVDTLNYELWTHCEHYSTALVSCKIEATYGCLVEHKNDSPTDTAPSGYTEAEFKGTYIGFTGQVGSTSVPVYLDSNGEIQEIGYTIEKSVPSDAKFTDTTYTANNGVSLSGTTFSNSGVRSTTINGNYLRVNTGGTDADLTIPYATKAGSADKLTIPSSSSDAITGKESSGGYLTHAYNNTGFPETYGNVLTVGGKGGSQLFMGWSGSTQGISKVYYRNRRDVATTSGECWSDWKAFAWSDHKHSGSDITSVTANNFLVGNGTSAMVEKTPTEVRSLIGAGTSSLTIGTSSTTAAAGNHSHGNITTDGKLQSSDVSIASGDKIVVTDSSNSNKLARTSLSFDGTTTSQALTKKGTFETFAKITWADSIPDQPINGMIYAI